MWISDLNPAPRHLVNSLKVFLAQSADVIFDDFFVNVDRSLSCPVSAKNPVLSVVIDRRVIAIFKVSDQLGILQDQQFVPHPHSRHVRSRTPHLSDPWEEGAIELVRR